MADDAQQQNALDARIRQQIEFYFSDSNLPRDRFLKNLVSKDKDGWVDAAVVASFKKVQALSTDLAVVTRALDGSQLVEVSSDRKKIRRSTAKPLAKDVVAQVSARSIYVKGFPLEATMEQIRDFFAKYGTVQSVRLRRRHDKAFKGSVFVEFASEEEAKAVTAKQISCNNVKLVMMAKLDYLKSKAEKANAIRAVKTDSSDKAKAGESATVPEAVKSSDFVKDCLVKFTDVPAGVSREDFKAMFEKTGATVAFVDFARGDKQCVTRIKEDCPLKATAVIAKIGQLGLMLKDSKPVLSALEGEAESEYWKKVMESKYVKKGRKEKPSKPKQQQPAGKGRKRKAASSEKGNQQQEQAGAGAKAADEAVSGDAKKAKRERDDAKTTTEK